MESLKNVYCEKMGLFRFLAEKIFSVAAREVARRWSARTAARRGVGVRGVLARRGVGVRWTAARRSGRLRCACGWTFLGACGWRFGG